MISTVFKSRYKPSGALQPVGAVRRYHAEASFLFIILLLSVPAGYPSDSAYIAFIISCSSAYSIYAGTVPIRAAYLAFSTIFFSYFVFSLAGIFSGGQFYSRNMIVRESIQYFVFILLFPPFLASCKNIVPLHSRRLYFLLGLIPLIIAHRFLWEKENISRGFEMYGVLSDTMAIQAFLTIISFVFIRSKLVRVLVLASLFLIIGAQTNQLILFFAILVSIFEFPLLGMISVIVCMIGALSAVPLLDQGQIGRIFLLDPDTAVRINFWQNAIDRIARSHFFGIGFGEGWHRVDALYGISSKIFSDPTLVFVTANHNSFIDITLRLGILGLATFIWVLASAWPRGQSRKQMALSSIIFVSVVLACFFNPAFESVKAEVYIIFALALLTAINEAARSKKNRQDRRRGVRCRGTDFGRRPI